MVGGGLGGGRLAEKALGKYPEAAVRHSLQPLGQRGVSVFAQAIPVFSIAGAVWRQMGGRSAYGLHVGIRKHFAVGG